MIRANIIISLVSYFCRHKNFWNFTYHISVPSEPLNLKAVPVTQNIMFLTWQTPQYPNGIIQTYSVGAGLRCISNYMQLSNWGVWLCGCEGSDIKTSIGIYATKNSNKKTTRSFKSSFSLGSNRSRTVPPVIAMFRIWSCCCVIFIRIWWFKRRCPWIFVKEINSNSDSPRNVIQQVYASTCEEN